MEHFSYTDYPAFLQFLHSLSEPKFAVFQRKLIPGETILGVRVPRLRALAKQIAKGDWRRFLSEAQDGTMEEVMAQGLVVGSAKMEYGEALECVAAFVPKIRSWAVCDTCTSSFCFLRKNPAQSFEFLKQYAFSAEEFATRFGVVATMDFFVTDEYLARLFELYNSVHLKDYYVKMAVAWAVSVCFIKFPERTMKYLEANTLDDWVYNKALQKITESYRVDAETKQQIRTMKRKYSNNKKIVKGK